MTDNTPTSESGYAGQQDPSDSSSDYNVLQFIIKQALGLVSTATLVQVKGVRNDGGLAPVGTVDVQPLVNLLDGIGRSSAHGTIFGLSYFRLQGGSNAVIMDPQVGDIGLAVFADRDISAVKASKARSNPGSRRRFSMSDGLYFGMFLGGTPNQYVQFNSDGMKLADKNGNTIVMSSAGVTINGVQIDASGNISGAGTYHGSGEGTFGAHTVGGHIHPVPGVQTGGSTVNSNTPTG